MKIFTILFLLCCINASAQMQQNAQPQSPMLIVHQGGSFYDITWHGVQGRTYFIQISTDLEEWFYLEEVDLGEDLAISYTMDFPSEGLFVRLKYVDILTTDPASADFDFDGVTNGNELIIGTDPFVANNTGGGGGGGAGQYTGPADKSPDGSLAHYVLTVEVKGEEDGDRRIDYYMNADFEIIQVVGEGEQNFPLSISREEDVTTKVQLGSYFPSKKSVWYDMIYIQYEYDQQAFEFSQKASFFSFRILPNQHFSNVVNFFGDDGGNTNTAWKITPLNIKIKQDAGGGETPMYFDPMPENGQIIGELFSLWDGEAATVEIGGPLKDVIDGGKLETRIEWSAPDIPNQIGGSSYNISWAAVGHKVVNLDIGSRMLFIHVEIPDVGSIDEGLGLVAVIGLIDANIMNAEAQLTNSLIKVQYEDTPVWRKSRPDAVRHSTWMARCAQRTNSFDAGVVGQAHEYHNRHSDGGFASDSTMDLHNNNVGILKAAALPDKTLNEWLSIMDVLYSELDEPELHGWNPPDNDPEESNHLIRLSNQGKIHR